jgi:predicted anti-sigma-YlaC factor YlaD
MDCAFYREAISARIDGEGHGLEPDALHAHLASCLACRSWADQVAVVTRRARMAPAEPVPDLVASIMDLEGAPPAPVPASAVGTSAAGSSAAGSVGIARLALFLVAVAQLGLAIPALLGDDGGAPIHVAHEQGSWLLALAVGLLIVAWRPDRASVLLPVVAVLVAALGVTMIADIAAGRTQAAAEAPHGLALLGLGLLWVLAHPGAGRPTGMSPPV